MKKVRINFVDFHSTFSKEDNEIINDLRERYEVELSENPDYLFYSVFGNKHLDYDCVRIFYTGECVTPDFNECDYAFGFDRLSFGDRYERIPLYLLFRFKPAYLAVLDRKPVTREEYEAKKGFCSFVVSNCFAFDRRTEILDKINEYKKVDSGGRYRNNIGGAVKDKLAFQKDHRFAITFENTSYPGYTTEKIVDAFAAYTIPIYYGDPTVTEDFNEDAFINCHRYENFDQVLDVVKQIDNDEDLALQMLNTDPLKVRQDPEKLKIYLFHIFDQDLKDAHRRPVSVNVRNHEAMIRRHRFYEENVYRNWQRVKNQFGRISTGTLLTNKRSK